MNQVSSSQEGRIIIGDSARIAQRYAGALYDLAQEQKQLDAVATDFGFLHTLLHESSEFKEIVSNPRLTQSQSSNAIKQVVTGGKLHSLTTQFLGLLVQKHRLGSLASMIAAFLERLATERGEFKAEVCSAKPLTAGQQEQLASKLQQLTGGKVHLHLTEDASLLGGLRVKLGSKLIDASIKTKLARLERQLKSEQTIVQEGAA